MSYDRAFSEVIFRYLAQGRTPFCVVILLLSQGHWTNVKSGQFPSLWFPFTILLVQIQVILNDIFSLPEYLLMCMFLGY